MTVILALPQEALNRIHAALRLELLVTKELTSSAEQANSRSASQEFFRFFMEPEFSFPFSQESTTEPYLESGEIISQLPTLFP